MHRVSQWQPSPFVFTLTRHLSREAKGRAAATLHPELPPGPLLSVLMWTKERGGLVPEKGQRPFNELRKAHLLTITA